MRVFVKNLRGEPLMPCNHRKARILLKQGKAKIMGYTPFTIQLQYATGEAVQPITIGVDSGAKHIGIAITNPTQIQEYDQSGEFCIKQFRKKKRSLHEATARKGRKTKNTSAKRNNKNTPHVNGIYLGDKVKVFGQVGFVTGFTVKMVYVQNIHGQYIQNPAKSYKQVKISDIERIHHTNNWQFLQIS
jgi:Tfp pilus assembly protein PilW